MKKSFVGFVFCLFLLLFCGVFFVSCKKPSNPNNAQNCIENIVVSQDFFDLEIFQNDNVDLTKFQVEIQNSIDEDEQKLLSELLQNLDTTKVGKNTTKIKYKDYSFDLTYEIKSVEIINVTYIGEAVVYYLCEGIEFNDEKITVKYSNEKIEERDLSETELDFSEIKNEVGKQTITGIYEGFEFEIEVDVKKRPITNVSYTGEAVAYYLREGVEFNGEKITVKYSNGRTEERDLSEAELDFSEIKNEVGKQTVKGTFEGFEFDIEVDVKKRSITNISYTDEAVTYYLHESAELNDEKFTILYSNGRREDIDLSEAEVDFSSVKREIGKQTITGIFEGIEFDIDVEVKTRKVELNKEYKLTDKTGMNDGECYALLTETHVKIYTKEDISNPYSYKITQSDTENEWTLRLSLPAPTLCTIYLTAEGLVLVKTSEIWN